ncbi:SLOG family protein [Streptomyces zaomyceticus]|uniref:SLOG family protein n=1 Tax=Streptomyces zaomyceticus TaxID=68286 RepID=UPI00352C4917
MLELSEPRVLVCGSRRWPWSRTVETVLDRLTRRYSRNLVVIEGAATGADRAAYDWCGRHGLDKDRHRCRPGTRQPRSVLSVHPPGNALVHAQ